LKEALDNEDVLLALNTDVYKALLNFLLRAFAREKEFIERESVATDNNLNKEQNEITKESQKLISKLLNSKEFTVSLLSLFQLLRESMPDDLSSELSIEDR